jgi:integrase
MAGRRSRRRRAHAGRRPFKPSTVRAYEQALRLRVYPTLETAPFYRVRRVDLQNLVDRLVAAGAAPATVNTTIGALGAIYGRAVQRNELDVSPTVGVRIPAVRNGRERFATPEEATRLLAAVPARDAVVWASALYAGLRRGELMALRWSDVDLKAGTIDVTRSWDPEHGPGDTKNRNRRRFRSPSRCASVSPPSGCASRPGASCASAADPGARSAPTSCRSARTRRGSPLGSTG